MKKFFTLSFFLFLFSFSINAKVKDVKISGLKRFHPDMVKDLIKFDNIKKSEISDSVLNNIVLKLHSSSYFKNVKVNNRNNILYIELEETPIIKQVVFEGYDKVKLDDLQKAIKTKSMGNLDSFLLKQDIEAIKTLYKRLGLFKTTVDVKTIERQPNQYDIVFEINENHKAYIKKIIFHGNEKFSSSKLEEVIMSKEYSWWKLLEVFDVYDEDRLIYDGELLKNFYNENGFLDFKLSSYSAKMDLSEKNFFVDFYIDEGSRYKVNKIDINSEIPDLDIDKLKDSILLKQGDFYNELLANESIRGIETKMGTMGFAFVYIDINKNPDPETSKVDLTFEIKNSKRVFINKIDIKNNTRTYNNVIRKQLDFDEQDIFNSSKLSSSKQKLMETGFFENVKIMPVSVPGSRDKIDIIVEVVEKSTGELSFGAGWSSMNSGFLEFGIRENNFMGKGQTLGISTTFSKVQSNYSLSFVEPYLFDRDLLGGVDVYYSKYSRNSTYGYDIDTIGLAFKLGWSYNDNLYHSIRWSGKHENMTNVSSKLSDKLLEGIGSYNIFKVGNTLTYRDQTLDYVNDTRSGFIVSLSTDYAGFGGDKFYIKNVLSAKQSYSFWDNVWQFGIALNAGHINSLKNKILSRSDRFMLGGDTLRGFDYSGVGARSSTNSLYAYGGDWEVDGTFQLNFPIGIPKKYKVSGYIFYDWGILGKPKLSNYKKILYDNDMRTSVGYGISWNSPIGAMTFSWGYPMKYKYYDDREIFRFSIGSDF